jgi:putative molybdopterin biosynthesis protein
VGDEQRIGKWTSTTAVATRLGLSVHTVYGLIDRGDLPAYRIGRVIRLKSSDVDHYIESARIEPGSIRRPRDTN